MTPHQQLWRVVNGAVLDAFKTHRAKQAFDLKTSELLRDLAVRGRP